MRCLSQARINWESCGRKGIQRKMGWDDGDGSLISPDGVASSRIVGAFAFVIFPCTIRLRSPALVVRWLDHLDAMCSGA